MLLSTRVSSFSPLASTLSMVLCCSQHKPQWNTFFRKQALYCSECHHQEIIPFRRYVKTHLRTYVMKKKWDPPPHASTITFLQGRRSWGWNLPKWLWSRQDLSGFSKACLPLLDSARSTIRTTRKNQTQIRTLELTNYSGQNSDRSSLDQHDFKDAFS